MRQVVSLIKDNQAHFALVDEEDGSIIPFADLLIPDPDRFGMMETATLGSNLIAALGLNGTKRPKSSVLRVGEIQPGHSPAQASDVPGAVVAELPPVPPRKKPGPKPKDKAQHESNYKGRPPTNGKYIDPDKRVQRYIPTEEVLQALDGFKDGATAKELAAYINGKMDETPPKWIIRTVENRLAQMGYNKDPRVRFEHRDVETAGGKTRKGRFVVPVPASDTLGL